MWKKACPACVREIGVNVLSGGGGGVQWGQTDRAQPVDPALSTLPRALLSEERAPWAVVRAGDRGLSRVAAVVVTRGKVVHVRCGSSKRICSWLSWVSDG